MIPTYKLLVDFLKSHKWISGIDLDIEETVNINQVKKLINDLNRQFPYSIMTMAPVLEDLQDDSCAIFGLNYKDLYNSPEGKRINWFNGQFYGSFNLNSYNSVIQNGYSPNKIVMGMESIDFDKQTFPTALNEVKEIKQKYPTFGGVYNWEYYDSPPDNTNPLEWALEMSSVLT